MLRVPVEGLGTVGAVRRDLATDKVLRLPMLSTIDGSPHFSAVFCAGAGLEVQQDPSVAIYRHWNGNKCRAVCVKGVPELRFLVYDPKAAQWFLSCGDSRYCATCRQQNEEQDTGFWGDAEYEELSYGWDALRDDFGQELGDDCL